MAIRDRWEQARRRVRAMDRATAFAALFACLTVVVPCLVVVWPWLGTRDTFGFHDWDVQTSHRYLTTMSLATYHEWPGWDPYACGGFPAWGYVESGTTVVSPWLPFYLFGDIRTALRVEVLGMALAGSIGTFLAAGRLTESIGARALVVALFAVNGRWGLQTASGHTWHLSYALMPWAFWAFERARVRPLGHRHLVGLGAVIAMLVYTGGIYPLPHTILLLGLWAGALCLAERSARPIAVLAGGGAIGVGLSAPKLLPLLATFDRAPRLIESQEKLSLGAFWTLLTSRDQAFFDRPAAVTPYGWHEWGMYVSVPGAVLLVAALLTPGAKEGLLKVIGLFFVVLGFGAFHRAAPWTLLHAHAPVFRSQHVPSRFLYPAVLILGLALASGAGKVVARLSKVTQYADAIVAAAALLLAWDIATVAEKPMAQAMVLHAPEPPPKAGAFHFERDPPFQYRPRDWAGPMYLAMLGNTGVINCYGAPPFEGHGALSSRDPRYRGEVTVTPDGVSEITAWSPNGAHIEVRDAPADARLVYNMNYDRGWVATLDHGGVIGDVPVVADRDRVSVAVPPGASEVDFRYRPPGLRLGLALFAVTLVALGGWFVYRRRAPRGGAS